LKSFNQLNTCAEKNEIYRKYKSDCAGPTRAGDDKKDRQAPGNKTCNYNEKAAQAKRDKRH